MPFTAELGGKGPLIVFADADLDAAAAQGGRAVRRLRAGLPRRHPAARRGVGARRVPRRASTPPSTRHVLGDSRDPATTIAPMIHPDHVARVLGLRRAGPASTATASCAAAHRVGDTLHVEPTLIEPASNDSEIVQREVFGPVLTLQTFADEDEAIELANSTPYGLSAIVYTASQERAERVGRAVRSGIVWVNTFLVRDLTAPFGGIGISGIGREGGDYALDFHSDLKTLQIADDTTS